MKINSDSSELRIKKIKTSKYARIVPKYGTITNGLVLGTGLDNGIVFIKNMKT